MREAQEAERKKAAFWKAQMEGKTDQAKSDLARLAIIKKQREEAARKRQEELQGLTLQTLIIKPREKSRVQRETHSRPERVSSASHLEKSEKLKLNKKFRVSSIRV